jgi:hypothetical protein
VIRKDNIDLFLVPAGESIRLKDHNPGWAQTEEMEELGKESLKERARKTIRSLELKYPDLTQEQRERMTEARRRLLAE